MISHVARTSILNHVAKSSVAQRNWKFWSSYNFQIQMNLSKIWPFIRDSRFIEVQFSGFFMISTVHCLTGPCYWIPLIVSPFSRFTRTLRLSSQSVIQSVILSFKFASVSSCVSHDAEFSIIAFFTHASFVRIVLRQCLSANGQEKKKLLLSRFQVCVRTLNIIER